ncbi:MAG: 4-(cytidine 5'-diphospho)-2-C-methyl-D-erythritol kinase [Terriglobia bacterium]
MPPVRLRAFAKINQGLKILSPRPDGYHEIRTVYHTLALHDRMEISLQPKRSIDVECSDTAIPTGKDNLAYRAAELWMKSRNWRGGVRVRIEKRIPAGGGLGGGSSDAAATLLGLEFLAGNALDRLCCFQLAAALGSDVPLFLLGGRVLGCGRGEEVYPLADLPSQQCVVVHPDFNVSTAEAYREADRKLTMGRRNSRVKVFGVWSQFPLECWGPAENDFEKVVFAKWPGLARLKAQFIRAGAETASLTGSGSAVYAIFGSATQANRAASLAPPGWRVFRTRTLTRREYQRSIFVRP